MAAEHDTALLCVTHSNELAERFPHSVSLAQGRLMFDDAVLAKQQ
jgi:predicted ABC-type transport system involved in lysophospholipase L1 biosynthesis ATPase subunit